MQLRVHVEVWQLRYGWKEVGPHGTADCESYRTVADWEVYSCFERADNLEQDQPSRAQLDDRAHFYTAETVSKGFCRFAARLKGQAVRVVPLQALAIIFSIWNVSYCLPHAQRFFGASIGCCISGQSLCLDPLRLLHSLCLDLSRSCRAFFLLIYHTALYVRPHTAHWRILEQRTSLKKLGSVLIDEKVRMGQAEPSEST